MYYMYIYINIYIYIVSIYIVLINPKYKHYKNIIFPCLINFDKLFVDLYLYSFNIILYMNFELNQII